MNKAELIEENKKLNRLVAMYKKELDKIRASASYRLLEALKGEIKEEIYKIHFSE